MILKDASIKTKLVRDAMIKAPGDHALHQAPPFPKKKIRIKPRVRKPQRAGGQKIVVFIRNIYKLAA